MPSHLNDSIDVVFCAGDEACGVSVLNAEDKLAAVLAREEIIIECRADSADMQGTCWTGGEANAYVLFGHCLDELAVFEILVNMQNYSFRSRVTKSGGVF